MVAWQTAHLIQVWTGKRVKPSRLMGESRDLMSMGIRSREELSEYFRAKKRGVRH